MNNEGTQPEAQPVPVLAQPGGLVGKLATKVGVAKGGNNFILSFIAELPGEPAQLIERVVLDEGTIGEMVNLLESLRESGVSNDK